MNDDNNTFWILIIIAIIAIIIYFKFTTSNEEFALSAPRWKDIGYVCVGNNYIAKQIDYTDPSGMQLRKIQCLGTNLNATKCASFPGGRNIWACSKQIVDSSQYQLEPPNTVSPVSNSSVVSNILVCDSNGSPGCDDLYKATALPQTYIGSGITCDLGNGTIPTKITDNKIQYLTSPTGTPVIFPSKDKCNEMIQKAYTTAPLTTCGEGKIGEKCITVYDSLGLKTFRELGYSCWKVKGKTYVGRLKDAGFEFASYDGVYPIENCGNVIDFSPSKELIPINCQTYKDNNPVCPIIFDELNLYPTTNKLTIRANNINQGVPIVITNSADINKISMNNINELASINGYNPNTSSGILSGLNGMLDNYPIKVACCNRKANETGILNSAIHVALNPNTTNENYKKWNYELKNLSIPADTCPANLYAGSNQCNAFYDINCANQLANFRKLGLPDEQFVDYSPECACYAPKSNAEKQYSDNIPSKCYKANCGMGVSYLDPISREGQCNLTICSNIINTNDITAGGSANISNQVKNECGNFLPTIQGDKSNGGNASVPIPIVPEAENNTNPSNPLSPSAPINNNSTSADTINNDSANNETQSTSTTSSSSAISTKQIVAIIVIILILLIICASWLFFRKT